MNRSIQNNPILVAHDGPLDGDVWVVDKNLVVGRDDDCDITILDRQVSRLHARIEQVENSKIRLIDLESKNGTYVNGKKIKKPIFLKDGDEIKIALIQEMVFISSDATLPLEIRLSPATEKTQKLIVDEKARRVWIGDEELLPTLSVSQYKLLVLLYHSENSVVTRETIIKKVWGDDAAAGVSEQALDALVRRLRNRLIKKDPTHEYIGTIRSVGYIFKNTDFEG